ncbi:hypothetical protein [Fontibacillus phaseoli]|uniref:hypothetical protein n=1 Tax=Fontibacillus phaseoli TaxID=1416533 RepID=UPI0015F0E540|nr:hypothetical protein [Fontibacillus phaseoli]
MPVLNNSPPGNHIADHAVQAVFVRSAFVYGWAPPDPSLPLRGILQIAHGMSETAARYRRFKGGFGERRILGLPMTTGGSCTAASATHTS